MPGSVATLATCQIERSPTADGSRASEAKTTPGTRISPRFGTTQLYGASWTRS
jgi:hypothetical protein